MVFFEDDDSPHLAAVAYIGYPRKPADGPSYGNALMNGKFAKRGRVKPFFNGREYSVVSIRHRSDSLQLELGTAPVEPKTRTSPRRTPKSPVDKLREAARDDLEEQFPNFGRKLSDEVVDVFIVIRWSHLLNPDMVGGLSDGAKLLCEILEVNMKNIKIGIRRGSYETHRMWGDFSNSDEFGESNSAFAARSNGLIETLRGQNVDLRDRCKRVKGRSRQLADFGSEIGALYKQKGDLESVSSEVERKGQGIAEIQGEIERKMQGIARIGGEIERLKREEAASTSESSAPGSP